MAESVVRLSPRQKMINLMYIVLTAMLALNVSSDVLDGFVQVEDGLARTNATVGRRNDAVYSQLETFTAQNPEKGAPWLAKASDVRKRSAALYSLVDSLKLAIVVEADGPEGNPAEINRRDDLEAAAVVMLSPGAKGGQILHNEMDSYRGFIQTFIADSIKRTAISEALSTAPFKRPGTVTPQKWEEAKFENQPVVAAVTLLTKLQNDIRYAEGEALASLLASVDAGDVRVNEINAFVIPQSRIVMRGGKYSANIVLAAVDTTARPEIFVAGKKLGNDRGLYEFVTSSTGTFDYNGYLEVNHGDGTSTRHPFSSSYTVMEPTATVSATMMNVLYAGIDNPMSISVPGVPMNAVSATMTNGSLTRKGDAWVARPAKVGENVTLTVSATIDGRPQTVATSTFRVRKLPDPVAFITYSESNGAKERYKGGRPLSKTLLTSAPGIDAAIDDDMLNIDFQVLGFETVFFDQMGNAIPEVSQGASFSQRQKDQFKRLSRGKRFYISRIRAKGPDGIERVLSPVEVIVN
ncbi:gliding motility protein GldM [Duncaniella sp.]|uniref:type IX secretion system motor protein PorM/GldM n=1 Tax=Duncaniella TaxID=2518495 RepID=UPI000E849577|nr:gliding motility protein GldM [Duncaniella sp.]MBJ2190447.1 gliding motility protein GldM [Muribaculaceae bacterium]HBN62965.1 gliding motility protein GldM [Porphyromonadaceae bacterium]